MVELQKITEFLNKIKENRDFTGDVSEQFFNGEVEIRMTIGETDDNHRAGSFSILLKWDGDFDELAKQNIYHASDINQKYEELENKLIETIDETLGYNAYEPLLDKADPARENNYDIVFHDSVIVYD